jgi:hypothetical protein
VNLHHVAVQAVCAVNPQVRVTLQVSNGQVTNADGTRSPQYMPPALVMAQIQALTADEIRHVDALNIQGEKRAIYLTGKLDGLVRPEKKGGDIIVFPDGSTWLVVLVLEYWPDWCKVAVTLQNKPFRPLRPNIPMA